MSKINKLEWIITFVILLGVVYGSYTLSRRVAMPVETKDVNSEPVEVVLDAGHGGKDPGKIGVNGEKEKDINLEIAFKVQNYLEDEGIHVVMTRDADARTDENGAEYSKTEDMKTRVEMINELNPKLVVSIHQNSYQSEEIKGAQVFYYTNSEEAMQMADIMQEALRVIDPTNDRQIKADNTYYMLKRTNVPTLIVECGFLTNLEEAKKLTDEAYQEKLAKAIADGIKNCLGKNRIAAISI